MLSNTFAHSSAWTGTKRFQIVLTLFAALVLLFGSGCKSPAVGVPMSAEDMSPTRLVLAPGDALQITFPGATNLSGVHRIGPEGSITMPLVGQVQAGGKTALELQDELLKLYENELQDKEVIVSLAGSANIAYVMGYVLRPGPIQMSRSLTALEAILEAGGFAETANLKKVTVIRYEGEQKVTYSLNLEPIHTGGPVPPFYLRPRDIVNVPKKMQWF